MQAEFLESAIKIDNHPKPKNKLPSHQLDTQLSSSIVNVSCLTGKEVLEMAVVLVSTAVVIQKCL